MCDIISRWIQTQLGVVIKWTTEKFCNRTRDGYLLSQILRSYGIISEEQLNMISKSEIRLTCIENFQKHIIGWLRNIDIYLEDEEVTEIVDCNGITSLCVFYKVFLELQEKSNLSFITQQRLNEKLRPRNNVFIVEEVKSSHLENIPTMKNKYSIPLDDCYDVIHWHQDRLETLINKCKSAREEYNSLSRVRERRLSSNSADPSIPVLEPLEKELKPKGDTFESEKSIDLSYDQLIAEQNKCNEMKKFEPNLLESKKILKKYNAKFQKQAENAVFKKQLHKTILNDFWNRIQSKETKDTNKDLTEKLLKQSLYEKQMLRKLSEIKHQREVMIQNKQVISDAIMKEKETEFFEAFLQKDKNLNKKEFEYYLEKEKLYKLHKIIYNEKLRLKSERCNKMCMDIVSDICNIALKECEYKELFGEEPMKSVKDSWKKMFVTAETLEDFVTPIEDIVKSTDDLPEEMETIVHNEIERQDKLDEMDFESYKNFESPWELENIQVEESLLEDMSRGQNILGYIVHVLLETKYPLPALRTHPNLPKVQVAACVNGISDISCLYLLQKLLKHKLISVIEMQDAINFCVNAFKEEMKPGDEDEGEDDEEAKGMDHKKKDKSKKDRKHKKGAKLGSEISGKKLEPKQETIEKADKKVQTPRRYPCEEIQLTSKAELGSVAEEELSNGRALTDYLLIHMFIEFLNSTPDMKGWVLINYPSTLEQAILLEEALTGVSVPSIYKIPKNEGQTTDLGLDEEGPLDEHEELRHSKLLKNPVVKKESPFFDSALTAYIKMNQQDKDDKSADQSKSPEELENDTPPLEKFYSDMGCNYSMYFNNFDFDTVKYLAKLIIGDYSIPPKSSLELFGDTIKYMDNTDMSKDENIKSVKKGEKNEPERREKLPKPTKEIPKADTSTADHKQEKKSKKRKKAKPEPVIIVHEDKFTQIPEIIYDEEEVEEEEGPAEPGEEGWEYIRNKLPEELQISLASLWENAERVYIGDFSQVLFMKRLIMNPIIPAIFFSKNLMKLYIDKPDDKQLYLRKFQQTYNEFDDEIRSDEEFKAELHCRSTKLFPKVADIYTLRLETMEKLELVLSTDVKCVWKFRKQCSLQQYFRNQSALKIMNMCSSAYLLMKLIVSGKSKTITGCLEALKFVDGSQPMCLKKKPTWQNSNRVNEMREKLIEVCDRKMMGTEQERCTLLGKGWASKQLIQLINNYINALQLEIDRHVDTSVFLGDYYMGIITKMPNENPISKEILTRFELEDLKINTAVYNLLVNVEDDEDPFVEILEHMFSKALSFVNKCQNWSWSIHDKAKSQFPPDGEKEKGKTAKKEKKKKKGEKTNFEPDENVKKILSRLFDEWACALKGETARLTIRINLLKFVIKQNIDEVMKCFKDAARSVYEDIRSKYRKEIDSITDACSFLSKAIETETPIQQEMIFKDSQFFVDANSIHFPDVIPEKVVIEIGQDFIFTVGQLEYLTDIFIDLAPSGNIPERCFIYLLQDMIADEEKAMTPKSWSKLSTKQVEELSKTIFGSNQSIQWKEFIIYNLMVPFPSVEDLLELRTKFIELDINGTEIINEEQFDDVRFWFEALEDDIRLPLIKNLIFKLYKVTYENFNYTAMLFDFCKGSSTPEGLGKALSLSTGRALCWDGEIGKKFIENTLEQRREHEEEVRIRNEERKETEEFAKTIIAERIDETVHKCESVIIEDLDPVKEKKIDDAATNLGNSETNKSNHVTIVNEPEVNKANNDESDKKIEKENDDGIQQEGGDAVIESLDNPEEDTNEKPSDENSEGKSNSINSFENIEIGFETNPNPNLQYFIQLDNVLSILTIVLSWSYNVQSIEEKSFCEILEEIYNECKNPQFNDEVLSHEYLNHPKLLNLLTNITTFLVKNPPEIVTTFLSE